MSHFLFPYAGNKRNEYKHFKNYINYDGIKNIIEPFCGTSAISFNIWLEHKDRFNYYLNDNSQLIYETYLLLKNDDPSYVLQKIKEVKNNINNKEDFINLFKSDYDIYENIVLHKLSAFRLGLFKNIPKSDYKFTKLQLEFFEFIKCPYVHISNNDWSDIFNDFKNNDNAIIIFDPPYLARCNDYYMNKTINIYEYLFNNNIKTFKSHIYLVLEDIWIIKLLFKDNNILIKYDKKYETSKSNTHHILIYNK